MNRVGASVALALVAAWVVFACLGFLPDPVRVGLGLIIGTVLAFALPRFVVTGGALALLAPFGLMLPVLALRHMGVSLGLPIPGFAKWELVVFLLAYAGFLLSAFGVIRVDLYRLGYAARPVGIMVLAICAYGLVTGNWLLPLVAVMGQVFWGMKWGSSNWFDHVLHVLLWPVALIVLLFG